MEKKSEISCILASLIFIENDIEINEKKITSLLDFAGIKFEKYWPTLFLRLSKSFDLPELIGCKKTFPISKTLDNDIKDLKSGEKEEKQGEKAIKELSEDLESEGGDLGFGLFD